MELASERVYYVHCNFCNTILAVSVPCSNMLNIVTVRCGHCGNLLSVTMGVSASLQPFPPPNPTTTTTTTTTTQKQQLITCGFGDYNNNNNNNYKEAMCGSSSAPKCNFRSINDLQQEVPKMPPPRPPEKRQRVPSAYNRFIKEEIQRIKASNPDISHREAFSAAAKNWAHFPHIHFGLKLDGSNQTKLDQATVDQGSQESNGFY